MRVMDKCPDAHCGVDLGGAPARDVMGMVPGRYAGEWSFVSCRGQPGVSDGPTRLFVKEGSNPYWSLIQVRDPAERVVGIQVRRATAAAGGAWTSLAWATEAENFFSVPKEVLQDSVAYDLKVELSEGVGYTAKLPGSTLAVPGELALQETNGTPPSAR